MNTLNTITSAITISEYHLKDHLGNTRVTVDNTGKKVQTNNYYPFGMTFATSGNPTNKYLYNGKELQEETDWLDYGARMYDAEIGRWHVIDAMAEKYESWTVYQYVRNNPILRIDPSGMDDYKINRDTGAMELVKKTDDKTDRVLKTYSRKSKRGEVKYKKNGEAKVAFGDVEKGILSNGINFQENDNLVEVGGDGKASEDGVKSFALKLSECVGKEITGLSYSSNSSGNITDMVIGKYKYNTSTGGKPAKNFELYKKYRDGFQNSNVFQVFHTHPNGALGATYSNPEMSTDYQDLQMAKPRLPNASFVILLRVTGQVKPREYDYTFLYKPRK